MSTSPLVIAIDGPSGSGKSSTSRGVANRLGLARLDTGSMYRAVACRVAHLGIDPTTNPRDAIKVAQSCHLEIDTSAIDDRVVIDGEDVTKEIRDPQTSAKVSAVATIQPVRDALTARMRQVAADRGRIVMEGRDITTVVCPDAQVRVLLVADPAIRVARRQAELGEKKSIWPRSLIRSCVVTGTIRLCRPLRSQLKGSLWSTPPTSIWIKSSTL
ncbi:cytidylate kinase [Cutibacterium acnes JCM 18909]|nr:cytidylate kinase [Cutibacterium acnes JCM 18909]